MNRVDDTVYNNNCIQTNRSKQVWEATIDSLPQLVCLLDSEQKIVRCNRTLETWGLGDVKQALGQTAGQLFHFSPDFQPQLDMAWGRLLSQEHSEFETKHSRSEQYFLVQIQPLASQAHRNDEPGSSYAVLVVTDITERKALEVQAIEFALEKQRAELLRQFVTDVTHDFKTPLAIINTSLYLLEKKETSTERRIYAERIEQQVAHLNKMVDSLLAMVRLSQRSEFQFELLDVNQLVHEVRLIMQDEAKEKNQALTCDLMKGLPTIPLEEAEMRQALCNLVENAIHYTPKGKAIALRTFQQGNLIGIEVEDTGMGISPEDLPHIFKRFYRADKARQIEMGRAGLGLPYVKNVVEVHGGRVEVESEVGVGSVFRILLPI